MQNKISKAIISRLPRYYRYLSELCELNTIRISSQQLSNMMGVTASQVRHDLSHFGEFGLQGYGYNVEYLRNEIGKVMGIDTENKLVLVGYGNLGHALLRYSGFANKGFVFKAIFDRYPQKFTCENFSIPIYHIDELNKYLELNDIDMIVLTLPKDTAQKIIDNLSIKRKIGIWNFASMDLKAPNNFIVENVHLSESLMRLSYKTKEKNK